MSEWRDDRTTALGGPDLPTEPDRAAEPATGPAIAAPAIPELRAPDPRDPVPDLGEPEPGPGPSRIDAALAELAVATRQSLDRQVAAYESVHRVLQDTLRSIEPN